MFRAIQVPAGEHEVSFVYSPTSFKLGALITFLTIAGVGLWSWGARKNDKS